MVSAKRLKKLSITEYRHGYLREMVTGWVIHQIKALRDERDWSQADLGTKAGKPQSAIARLESESYGNWNTKTLLEIAEAFDVALQIRFVSWPKFMRETEDTSPEAMSVPGFSSSAFILGTKSSIALDQSPPSPSNKTALDRKQTNAVEGPLRTHNPLSLYRQNERNQLVQ
ncbi:MULTISPECIES: helix-turn-helix transcriptional regulator [unclassified Mesorhizobium]|uniref:helix-turn-helix transcriptional regulator n=1 Tax=unclassified Mesorhizobium TaxID=325217 RepID=UPI000BAE80CE|nr:MULTISPECIES: helix-turn-helix transcriptional regulator [unclassified Mesorhizobium]PBC23449.1 hypothetical protein CK226_09980 [Mesorhizobium sp. WSM4311]TRD06815.1 helix-turn-helix transcriptional regulator [Mesorhizobium sp. WSM4305]